MSKFYAVDLSFLETVIMTARAVPADTPEEAIAKVQEQGEGLQDLKILAIRLDDVSDLEMDASQLPEETKPTIN
jgi:hypothetical protein